MEKFDFSSLDPSGRKIVTPKKSLSKKRTTEAKTNNSRNLPQKTSMDKIFEKLESLEKQLIILNQKIDQTTKETSISTEISNNIDDILSKIAENKDIIEIFTPNSNFMEELDYAILQSHYSAIHNLDWLEIFMLAHQFGWLANIYTFIRFLEKIDEIYSSNNISSTNLKTQWTKYPYKSKLLNLLGFSWEKDNIIRLGKTQKDLLDTFAKLKNTPQTSGNLFKCLMGMDPLYYDENKDNNIDLRRVRNVLSQLNKEGFIEKIRGQDNKSYFKIKVYPIDVAKT